MALESVSRRKLLAGLCGLPIFGQAAAAPLFRDPVYDGAADPVIVWNRAERCWWMLYTNRRANVDGPGVAWVHGTDIGVARSFDGGRTWRYMGVLPGLEFERGRNTFWAPEVLWHGGAYHMYCSYVPGVPVLGEGDRCGGGADAGRSVAHVVQGRGAPLAHLGGGFDRFKGLEGGGGSDGRGEP